ncbi:UNVERIFIED_CONTAM: hypothetical protein FKN15_053574 [Acipenser sinensis]
MQSLRASVEESSALNASLTQAREEKTLLERKVCELELSAKRLEGDVEQHRAACSQAQEELRKCREREAELRGELHRAEGEHSTLQGEVLESRAQGASPQQRLSESVQERLGLELQSHRLRQGTGREANPEQPQHRPSHRVTEEGVNKVEMGRLQSTLEEERLLASQHQLALQAQIGEGHGRAKSQESLLQQMGEECRQLKQDLQRTQNLFSSAERELRYEREKNLDQKRHGALLEQENTKVKAELKQAQSRLAGVEQASVSLSAELESSQQRGRELELELLHRTESVRVHRSLQEELRAESSRLLSADKKVRELQQQLKGAQNQLRLAETQVQEMEQLQRGARDSTESLATLRGRLQEEQLCRKLLEQKGEELQQQLRSLREKEASLSRSNTELNHRLHQQGARLSVLEEEHSTVTDEVSSTAQSYWLAGLGHQHSQKTNQNLSDQLLSCQHESEKLQEELRRVLHQLDSHVSHFVGVLQVRELQQQLKGAQNQLRLAETQVQEMEQLQRGARDSTESLATLRGRLQEEQLCRKLLEQKGEELQQQLRSLREKEASLSRSNTELNHRLHQQGARLSVLEEEHSTVTDEVSSTAQSYWKLLEQKGEELQQQLRSLREKEASLSRSNTELNHRLHQQGARLSVLEEEHSTVTDEYQHSQKTNQNLSDQLLSCQHESERLQEELRRVLHQLDSHVRRYSEKQARHKAKLRQAKEFFLRETVERDGRIRKLEKDLMLARSLAEKEQEWIRKVTDVNEKLLVEKRELLRRLSEEEELGQTCTRTISTKQHRACQDWDNGLCVFCGVQVKAELKQAQSRLAGVEQAIASLSAELESSQQRGRELELELLHRTESIRVQRSLQEEQRAESSRLLSADKKVRELQQQLKGAQHQLRLAETRVQEMEQLQREARDSTESLATLRGRLQEEQLCRKLLEQKGEELQQQLRSLREKEASLSRSNTELNHRLHQQGARLSVLEEEHSTVTDEHQHSQKTNQNLSDQLLSCQHESEKLQEELRRVLHQLDSHVRRYSEKQARHKAKLRRAKEFFLRETVERDGRIRKLEKDLTLARSLTEKEQEWIRKVTDVNEKLLVEKRELLRRLSEEEELGQTCTRTISTKQHRLNCLEEENRQLQDRTLRLSNQVGALERTLRSVQSVCSMEELKKAFPTESLLLNGSLLQPSNPSLTTGVCDTLGILDAIRRVKASEPPESLKSSFSTPRSQPSDIGYLNLSSPAARPGSQDPDESQSLGSDEV